eukprot:TRINITY_DN4661_c0_g1_i1.p7 TRINITY_DN4661_c0_g1~~TRINITY_DN4661_c0_g1_i1.p7  ORF type:complete len:166 (+),score=2.94 TRINITY_DN4661_c0_g1_i1:508-1005(+)
MIFASYAILLAAQKTFRIHTQSKIKKKVGIGFLSKNYFHNIQQQQTGFTNYVRKKDTAPNLKHTNEKQVQQLRQRTYNFLRQETVFKYRYATSRNISSLQKKGNKIQDYSYNFQQQQTNLPLNVILNQNKQINIVLLKKIDIVQQPTNCISFVAFVLLCVHCNRK